MTAEPEDGPGPGILRNKRDATGYRILVEIAERQPAVNQREVAESVGVTSQAVSDYLQDLIGEGYVEKHGRGRYEVTKEGVDWLISQTDELRDFARYVSEKVVDQVETETVVAEEHIEEGERVSLSMRDGVLRATKTEEEEVENKKEDEMGATAVAITSGGPDEAIGVAEFEGVVNYETGDVTVVSVPPVTDVSTVDTEVVAEKSETAELVAILGTEALVTAREAGLEPDIRFGVGEAVREASMRGLSSVVLAVEGRASEITDHLRESGLSYEIIDTSTDTNTEV